MFDLVAAVDKYPEFMPWCGGAVVQSRDEHGMQASITISFAGIKQSFSTRNRHDYPRQIDFELVDGPFSKLSGKWEFIELSPDACSARCAGFSSTAGLLGGVHARQKISVPRYTA